MSTQVEEVPTANPDTLKSFYLPALEDVPAPARTLLEKYSKIPREDVLGHVLGVVSLCQFLLGKM
jgi:hypothetical protein